ncbi:MAG: hypothetical protein J6V73_09390 [Spirochaetaceae bacterium]|nr:hypothetical protein [Spirochaetaceae bacterium]MBP5794319.1 hypothetical protein [Spirochaetaceae bacterium]
MSYAALEKKLRMVSEQDFEFVAHFLDLVLENSKNRTEAEQNAEYLSMLDKSFTQLKNGEVVVKSMEELRAMEND